MHAITSLIITVLGFTADRASKDLMESKPELTGKTLAGDKIKLIKTENRGFALNTLDSNRNLVVTVSTVIFAFLLPAYILVLSKAKLKPLRFGFGLIMAGAVGNVYDRLVKGYVVDFINVSFLKKIIFNLADVYIVVGALFALVGECCVK